MLLAYPEMESIYNFANGHSVLPLVTLQYHSCNAYLFTGNEEAYFIICNKTNKNEIYIYIITHKSKMKYNTSMFFLK